MTTCRFSEELLDIQCNDEILPLVDARHSRWTNNHRTFQMRHAESYSQRSNVAHVTTITISSPGAKSQQQSTPLVVFQQSFCTERDVSLREGADDEAISVPESKDCFAALAMTRTLGAQENVQELM
jgi:hypothetical protein